MSFRNFILAAVTTVAVFFPATAIAEKWDLPIAYPATNYHSETAAEFAAEVTEKTGGKLEIVVHPDGALFGSGEIYGAVQSGAVAIGERLISVLEEDDAFFNLDNVPFLATTFAEARTLYEVSKPTLEKKLADTGVVFLYSAPWPPQGFYSSRPANSKADVAGLKFRAYNSITARIAELMGMAPKRIELTEARQAFATGAVESMIASGSTGYDRKLWEFVDYHYDVRAWLPRNMVFVNKAAWDGLDANTQKIIRIAAERAEAKGWARAEKIAGWYLEQLKQNGMNVAPPPAQLKADFITAGEQVQAEWLEVAGEEGRQLLERYRLLEGRSE